MRLNAMVFVVLLVWAAAAARSCDNPSCFVKKLFDFNYPAEGVYNIHLNENQTEMSNFIKAYGDFNSDLRSDYVAMDDAGNTVLFLFNTYSNVYSLSDVIAPLQGCLPLNFFLFDINGDGSLDITVWGSSGTGNCMYPLVQTNSAFDYGINATLNFTSATTQPSQFEFNLAAGGGSVKTNGLLLYNGDTQSRYVLYYQQGSGYQIQPWSTLFSASTPDYSTVPFSDQHWNTFIDLTNDCFPDFVLTNFNNSVSQIEFWVYNSSSAKFFLSTVKPAIPNMLSLSILDINYDGGLDLILGEPSQVSIYLGTRTLNMNSDFCVPGSYSFAFGAAPVTFQMEANQLLVEQNLQFADLNIDGYPEMAALVSVSGGDNTPIVYENRFSSGGSFQPFGQYNQKINEVVNVAAVTISFFDVLDNGIVDMLVNTNAQGFQSYAFYNNYLYQNSFYIKAFGTNGRTTSRGAQVTGASFYWLNSVANEQKVSLCAQITQASYNAFPMPYVLVGLGRANNYVEMFTIGRLGEPAWWSPIIPNSQLAIFSGAEPSSAWGIKIFIMPADSLVAVIIVCIVILTILGIILGAIKIRRKQSEDNAELYNEF